MFFLKKRFTITIIGIAVIITGVLLFLYNRTPQEPIIIYKTTPLPIGSEHTHGRTPHIHSDHSHSHDTYQNTKEETKSDETYDWRDHTAQSIQLRKVDPWEQIYTQKEDMEEFHSEDTEIYPPPNWYKTKDPELRAKYFYAQLIKQFGDIPEVHTIGEFEQKTAKGDTPTVGEYIIYLEAHYTLWPNEKTLNILKELWKREKRSQ
ncbi:MAG: hypothetical protein OXU51_18050 [Candidatus Poribacteria bacterium]|nr:hypothetical protein [Candidatus Poribacteria bacterium]